MMKKLFISIFAVVYLAIASGMVMNIHYCMGKVASVSFTHEEDQKDENCGKCGIDKTENHCCTDDVQFVKITDAHLSTQFETQFHSFDIAFLSYQINFTISPQGTFIEPHFNYVSPPPKTFNKVYQAVNTFLI